MLTNNPIKPLLSVWLSVWPKREDVCFVLQSRENLSGCVWQLVRWFVC
jgi:hypothetical protein